MNNFEVEYSNATTGWQWTKAPYVPIEESGNFFNGMYFNDEHVVPDYSPVKPFATWTNFRIKCNINMEKINIWAELHKDPTRLDSNGLTLQQGDNFDTTDRFFYWIKATNKDASYSMTQTALDPVMLEHAVTVDYAAMLPTISDQGNQVTNQSKIINEITGVLGWNPVTHPLGNGHPDALLLAHWSPQTEVARWITGWYNLCGSQPAMGYNPLGTGSALKAIADTYRMIDGVVETGHVWLGCRAGKYIYGKAIYSLEGYDFIRHDLWITQGWKAFGVEATGLHYG